MSDVGTTHEDLERFLAEHHLVGAGLKRDKRAAPREGKTAAHWKWDGIYRGLMRSGEIVTVGPGGMTGMRSVVGVEARRFPIWMNAQILMPGERTQCHRNLRSETRLVCQAPKDAVFVCEYEAYPMERGDVVISPAWTFHDHWNRDTTPAIWIDGYDNGYNPNININERFPDDAPFEEVKKPAEYGRRTLGLARPARRQPPFPRPPVRYPWAETYAALTALREAGESDPWDGVMIMLASPVDGGPTLPTIADTLVYTLADGTMVDDNIWLVGNSLWALRISREVFAFSLADELEAAWRWVSEHVEPSEAEWSRVSEVLEG